MRELFQFRVDEDAASLLFGESEGERRGSSVRLIQLQRSDPRFSRVGEIQAQRRRARGRPFFYGWDISRRFTRLELCSARVLKLSFDKVIEPAGEECGTKYDERVACHTCGAGARQCGPLTLDTTRLPERFDFLKTIAGEMVVSDRAANLLSASPFRGTVISPVIDTISGETSQRWFQVTAEHADAEIIPPTRIGIDPFDDDLSGSQRCPKGDLLGLNLLSEITIASNASDEDLFASKGFVGVRRGLLRPERPMFASQRLYRALESARLKGCSWEAVTVAP